MASLRTPEQVWELAARGVDTFTINAGVAAEILVEPLTEEAAAGFQRAADEQSGQS